MSIEANIILRDVTEVLHFTTNKGLLGILHTGQLLSRARLSKEKQLEYIFQPNAKFRKDVDWLDYVNLSISRINSSFFKASGIWHREENLWWCILSFDSEILNHEGVHFTTTNNFYSGVERLEGCKGFENMFAPKIHQYLGNYVSRAESLDNGFPTCEQAEVLYPKAVPTTYLKRIYVSSEEDAEQVYAQFGAMQHREIEVILDKHVFYGIKHAE